MAKTHDVVIFTDRANKLYRYLTDAEKARVWQSSLGGLFLDCAKVYLLPK